MLKKIFIICLCILLCLSLSSCVNSSSRKFDLQDKINFNYNNVLADGGFWISNDGFHYLGDKPFFNYYSVTKDGKKKLASGGGTGQCNIQQYGNKIYLLNDLEQIGTDNAIYALKYVDLETKKATKICRLQNCYNFLVLNKTIFYLEYNWDEGPRKFSLKSFSLDCDKEPEVICNPSVTSFGVIGNQLFYTTENRTTTSLFKYDTENKYSILIDTFNVEVPDIAIFNENPSVSYTDDYVFLAWNDSENNKSYIFKYAFDTKTVEKITVDECVSSFIAFDKNSYFSTYDNYTEDFVTKVFRFSNVDNKITEIARFEGDCDLFVGSDDGVYILGDGIKYYGNDGTISQVLD